MITMINHDTAVSNNPASASSVPVKNSAIYLIGPTSLSTNLTLRFCTIFILGGGPRYYTKQS